MDVDTPIDFPRVRASLLPWPQSNDCGHVSDRKFSGGCGCKAYMKQIRYAIPGAKENLHEAKDGRLPLNHHPLFQQHGRSNHRNDDHYCSHDQPVSPPSLCPRRPIVLLLPIVCGSLCCPSSLFFLLGFIMFSHGLPLGHQGGCRLWSLAA